MPIPVSSTPRTAKGPLGSIVTRTVPWAGVYFMALSTRLKRRRLRCTKSPETSRGSILPEGEDHLFCRRERTEPMQDLFRNEHEVDGRPVHLEHARVGARQEKEPFHQDRYPLYLLEAALQHVPVFFRAPPRAERHLYLAAQNGEGRLQLMGGIRGKLAHLRKGALQPAEHFIEGIGQPVQLVVSPPSSPASRGADPP